MSLIDTGNFNLDCKLHEGRNFLSLFYSYNSKDYPMVGTQILLSDKRKKGKKTEGARERT